MNTLNEVLNEGLLDDQEEILKKADASAEFQALLNKYQSNEGTSGCDCLGNKLTPGDLVLYIPSKGGTRGKQSLELGMVKKLTPKGVSLITAPHRSSNWWNGDDITSANVQFKSCIKISQDSI